MRSWLSEFCHRSGMTMDWRCRRSFLFWALAPLAAVAVVVLTLLVLNSQSNRWVFIFQSMVTNREGSHPWGESGPSPPPHFTGVWYRWHWNGVRSFEEHYTDGKLNGLFKAWDRSGRQWLETSYHEGRYHGDYILFYENGGTNRINHYFEQKPIGRWIHFYQNGRKWEERFFSSPGIPDGEETVWNTNGIVKFTHTWQKGEPWQGSFVLNRGTNWFRDKYESGKLVSTTNLGPLFYGHHPPAPQATNTPKK